MKTSSCDTVIIGAGLAGLSAARIFEDYNTAASVPLNYMVLEASDTIGGRAQSETLPIRGGKPLTINTGAGWIHDDMEPNALPNPLADAFRRSGDPLRHDPMDRDFYTSGQRAKDRKALGRVDKAKQIIRDHHEADTNLESLFKDKDIKKTPELVTTFGEAETGVSLDRVSVEDIRAIVSRNKGDFPLHGMGKFIEHYARDITKHVQLNTPVTKIEWPRDTEDKITIHTENGDVYQAKQVILTVSIGVLKSGMIAFEPPLPDATQKHLQQMYMGQFNKVFLVFDPKYKFPAGTHTHLDVRTKDNKDIFYLVKQNGQPVVTAFFGGNAAKLCDENPGEAVHMAIKGLEEIWGTGLPIIENKVTQWGKNPYVRGGYSCVEVGHYTTREILAHPIGQCLYLAGEAIGAKHSETGRDWSTHITGAVISGERAAKDIVEKHKKIHRQQNHAQGLNRNDPECKAQR